MEKLDLILEMLGTMQKDIDGLKSMQKDIDGLKSMQKDIDELKAMRGDVFEMKEGLDEIRGGVNTLLGWADDVACVVKVPLKPAQ